MDAFWQMYNDGVMGKCLFFTLAILCLALVVVVIAFIFHLADTSFLSYRSTQAQVRDKRFEPAHQTTTFISVSNGKTTTMIPQIIYYPDAYYLSVNFVVDGQSIKGEKEVDKLIYNSTQINDQIEIEFAHNRFTSDYTIR
jgi:ABC-type sulfate transport system permease component